jgi:tetratricopeptide (TPR) repeat protein
VLDLRTSCLDLRRRELKTLVGLLAEADPALQRNAAAAVGGLSPLGACADVAALTGTGPEPAPALKLRVQAVSEGLAEVRALDAAGRYPVAQERAAKLIEEARSIGYQPLVADVALEQLRLSKSSNQAAAGASRAREALRAAEAAGSVRLLAQTWSELAALQVDLLKLGEAAESLQHAVALEQGMGGDGSLRAANKSTQATLDGREGRFPAAEAGWLEVIALHRKQGASAALLANALGNLGALRADTGDPAAAIDVLEQAIATMSALRDDGHPTLQAIELTLAAALVRLGRLEEARPVAERSRRSAQAAGTTFNAALAEETLAEIAGWQGRVAEGLALFRSAVAGVEATMGADNPYAAGFNVEFGQLLVKAGNAEEALQVLRRAEGIAARSGIPDLQAYAQAALAEGLLASGEAAAAEGAARKAVALAQASGKDREVLRAHLVLGKVLQQRDPGAAKAELSEALAAAPAGKPVEFEFAERTRKLAEALGVPVDLGHAPGAPPKK